MVKKYIITGGPGTGKSSIILALEKKGEYVVPEAAADFIKLQQARGIKTPWIDPDFQQNIMNLQIQRELRIPQDIEKVFIDRGIPDGLAYLNPQSELAKEILEETKDNRYTKIFLIEELEETKKDNIRREDKEKALFLRKKIEQIYTSLGYEIVIIPLDDLDSRVEEILKHIDNSKPEYI